MHSFKVNTTQHSELIDITDQIQTVVTHNKLNDGLCFVFVPHTTAAITINENADPSVRKDIIKELNALVPWEHNYTHGEGNSAAHIKASLTGFSLTVCIEQGAAATGHVAGDLFCRVRRPAQPHGVGKNYIKIGYQWL
jgi:conserved hypothetical protein TIGR00149